MAKILNYLMLSNFLLAFCIVQVSSTFDRQHVAIVYEPITTKENYNINEHLPYVSKIATKFTKITFIALDTDLDPHMDIHTFFTSSVRTIPSAVATYNRDYLDADESPLELTMSLMISKTTDLSVILRDFKIIKMSAELANSIYPKTVTKIYLENTYLFNGNEADIDEYETELETIFLPNQTHYEIGTMLLLEDCESKDLPMFLRKFKHLAFSWYPFPTSDGEKQRQIIQNPVFATKVLIKQFAKCQEALKMASLDVSVELRTAWFYLEGTDMVEHDKDLTTYWNLLNDWAVNINITVVMFSAFDFDMDHEIEYVQYSGWWRMKQNISLSNITDDSFEEKLTRFSNDSHSTCAWMLIGIGVLIIAGAVLFVIFKQTQRFLPNAIHSQFARWFSLD